MKYEDIIKRLREPFAFKDVEWKIQVTTPDKARGMAVAYIDSRAIQNRLDEAILTTHLPLKGLQFHTATLNTRRKSNCS